MPRPSMATAELRKWKRKDNIFTGEVWNDEFGIHLDGTEYVIVSENFKRCIQKHDHYLVYTTGWVYKLMFSEEIS